jgi:hypothetical protein
MTSGSSCDPCSKKLPPARSGAKSASSNIHSARIVRQPDLKELSPLQRQRLDAAVMMLVNYLVSASSPQ